MLFLDGGKNRLKQGFNLRELVRIELPAQSLRFLGLCGRCLSERLFLFPDPRHQVAHRIVKLVLRGDPRSHPIVQIIGNAIGQRCKVRVYQQQIDYAVFYGSGVKIPRSLRRQAELFDRVVFLIGHIGDAEQKVSGHAEEAGELQQHIVSDLFHVSVLDSAEGGVVDAGFLRDLLQRELAPVAQILHPLPDPTGQIFHFCHAQHPLVVVLDAFGCCHYLT